ncbi:MAG: hypothetical protein PHZ00_04740 [Candidatus Peribacteraceae bacterium]|nr:hypothetical protein [Candidatus Peribacteraceae bacterium]
MSPLRSIIGGVFIGIMMTGCGNSPPSLKPEEVLRRTVITGRMLDSVALSTSGSMKLTNEGRISTIGMSATGVIHAGAAWSLHLKTVSNKISSTGSGNRIVTTLSSPSGGPVLLRLDAVDGPDAAKILRLLSGSTLAQWWLLAGDPSVSKSRQVTAPAHQDIGAFLTAFRVRNDHGITGDDGRREYHYSLEARPDLGVKTDPESEGVTVAGDVWIDAETFFLTRAVWHFADVPTIAGILSGTITVNLRDHNRASDFVIPSASAVRFPLKSFLNIVL